MTVFGIDLGTTYSCVAYIDDTGRPAIAKNRLGEDTTASVVYFEEPGHVVVGSEAKNAIAFAPDRTASLIKRYMAKDFERTFDGVPHTPESISALILAELARAAGEFTGQSVHDVVITVPAYFGVAERAATEKAGRIADLNVIRLVPEPVAAALHYEAIAPHGERTILVFDLGGGTFDTSVIRFSDDAVTVVCVDGDHELGGADWDRRVSDHLLERFMAENPESSAQFDEKFREELTGVAEQLKKSLSSVRSRRHKMRFDRDVVDVELTRETFEQITGDLFERTFDIVARTIDTARASKASQFDDVLLVGGATRMPKITEVLSERFGFSPRLHEPDLAVAKGAAKLALLETVRAASAGEAFASPSSPETRRVADQLGISAEAVTGLATKKVVTVLSRAFGITVVDETDRTGRSLRVEHILHPNTPLPAPPVTREFGTMRDNQLAVEIEIMEQAGAVPTSNMADNARIGHGVITELPALPANSTITVTFAVDESGLLLVHAVEPKSRKELSLELRTGGLSEEGVRNARHLVARYQFDD